MGWQQKNDASSGHQKILVDSSRDAGIIKIIVPASIATFLLLLININYSIIDIIAMTNLGGISAYALRLNKA